jgi:hypothetical protein
MEPLRRSVLLGQAGHEARPQGVTPSGGAVPAGGADGGAGPVPGAPTKTCEVPVDGRRGPGTRCPDQESGPGKDQGRQTVVHGVAEEAELVVSEPSANMISRTARGGDDVQPPVSALRC